MWHEAYECGDPTIDGEHQQLFILANELISAYIDGLIERLVGHFSDEEAILERHGFPDLVAHKRDMKAWSGGPGSSRPSLRPEKAGWASWSSSDGAADLFLSGCRQKSRHVAVVRLP